MKYDSGMKHKFFEKVLDLCISEIDKGAIHFELCELLLTACVSLISTSSISAKEYRSQSAFNKFLFDRLLKIERENRY